jgi:predicted ribosome quality control (RQC) complex YloA/Tae2 family protein
MMLLRKAKPWYLWMHLKDLPGNHLFVEKNKNRELNQKELLLAAKELIKFKKEKLSGENFPVQYTEVRFIRPIKGDKLGRVRVQQEQVLVVRSDN